MPNHGHLYMTKTRAWKTQDYLENQKENQMP